MNGYFCFNELSKAFGFKPDKGNLFRTKIDFNEKGVVALNPYCEITNLEIAESELGQDLYRALLNGNSFENRINATAIFKDYSYMVE